MIQAQQPHVDAWVLDFARRIAPEQEAQQVTAAAQAPPVETASRPQTPDELERYVWETFGVRIPKLRVCAGHKAPWEAFCAAYFATDEHSVIVIKGSRGLAGKSWLLALLGNVIALTMRADVTILGGSGAQSARVHAHQKKFWAAPNAPRDQVADQTITKTTFADGHTIEALMASAASVRGPHPLALIIDEADEMDLRLFDDAMGQTMDQHGYSGRTVIGSTHQHADGTMTEVLKRASERGWPVFEWCWRETVEPHGWLTEKQVHRKRNELTAEMWRIEVELGEPSIEGRAIATEKVERMFVGPEVLGGRDGSVPYTEFEPPVPGASYAHGADWARESDFVAMATFRDDVHPMRLVAYQQFRRKPTPYIEAQWEHQTTRYPGRGSHDSTSLGGRMMDDLINPEGAAGASVHEGVTMVGRVRQFLFTDYIIGVEHEHVVAPRLVPLYHQHKYVTNNDLRPGGTGHPPDGFVACCMAYRASQRATPRLRVLNLSPVHPSQKVPKELAGDPEGPPLPVTPLGKALAFLHGGNGHNGANGNGDGA